MGATLYGMAPSHPSHAARLMLERKGIEHKVVELPPGTHAAALRPLGFRRGTVPALKIDGRRVQGSLEISRALDEIQPEPPLFPIDPQRRAAVEAAERWGEGVLQDVPRLLARRTALRRPEQRLHMAREARLPAPRLVATLSVPAAWWFARKVGATDDDRVREAIEELPAMLDRVEELVAEGILGTTELNVADCQIAPSIRALLTFEDLAPLIGDREAARYARSILPDYPTTVPAGLLPPGWLEPLSRS